MRLHDSVNIVLRQTKHRDDPEVHEVLLIIVDVKGMLHDGRSHPKAGQKADCQKIHYEQRYEFLLSVEDLPDSVGP